MNIRLVRRKVNAKVHIPFSQDFETREEEEAAAKER